MCLTWDDVRLWNLKIDWANDSEIKTRTKSYDEMHDRNYYGQFMYYIESQRKKNDRDDVQMQDR